MLSCDSNGVSDIYLGVKPLIPLVVGEFLLMKTVKCHFLFIYGGKWVLILCLVHYCILNKGHELKWIVHCTYGVPIVIVIHIFHQYMFVLTSHH